MCSSMARFVFVMLLVAFLDPRNASAGITHVDVTQVRININMALCVWLSYYEANDTAPGQNFYWDKVGAVWFTVAIFPWYNNDNIFEMGKPCGTPWNNYKYYAKKAASDVSKFGRGKIGYLNVIGTNLTYEEAEDRLLKLQYWGTGYYVSSKTITVAGGPPRINDTTIDITLPFDKITIYVA